MPIELTELDNLCPANLET